MSFFSDGLSFGANRLQDAGSERVTYRRGSSEIQIAAAIGRSDFEVDQQNGSIIQARTKDFIVKQELLCFGGELTRPQRGDQIKVELGGQLRVFEVLPTPVEQDHDEDTHAIIFRIHTKEVAA